MSYEWITNPEISAADITTVDKVLKQGSVVDQEKA